MNTTAIFINAFAFVIIMGISIERIIEWSDKKSSKFIGDEKDESI